MSDRHPVENLTGSGTEHHQSGPFQTAETDRLRTKRDDDLCLLFKAYRDTPDCQDAEDDLLRWIVKELTSGAKRKYSRVAVGKLCPLWDYKAEAESRAIYAAESIARKLKKGVLDIGCVDSASHLAGIIGITINNFTSDAIKSQVRAEKRREVRPEFSINEDGSEYELEPLDALQGHQPMNYWSPTNYMFLQYLDHNDRKLIQAAQFTGYERHRIAEFLAVSAEALDSRIQRIGERMQDLRLMLIAFGVEPKHSRHLAQMFDGLVCTLQGRTRRQQPTTWAEVKLLAAQEPPRSPTVVHTSPEQVVRHLLKIWRAQEAS